MSADGFAAVREAIVQGKRGAPQMLSFDDMPPDLTDYAIGLKYWDADGQLSHRWVTVRSIDYDGLMRAYCWVRRDLRSFRMDRIEEAVDFDGQVLPGEEFAARLGLTVNRAPVRGRAGKAVKTKAQETRDGILGLLVLAFLAWLFFF